jgi:hypothetical protein
MQRPVCHLFSWTAYRIADVVAHVQDGMETAPRRLFLHDES